MIEKSKQGDVFEVGSVGDYQFILVFGYIGLNAMNCTWQKFKSRYSALQNIKNPFVELNDPIEVDGKWFQFIVEQENHGMSDSTLEKTLNSVFKWALKQQLYKIITNGIIDTNHSTDTTKNKQSNDRRVKLIREICLRDEYKKLNITLISLNDAYLKNE